MKKQTAHTGLKMLGFTTTLLLLLAVASVAVSPVAYAAKPPPPPLTAGMKLNITATGIAPTHGAFNITNPLINTTARVTFNATVLKSNNGGLKLNVTVGKLKIGSTVYKILKGIGRIGLHSHKIIVHLVVNGTGGSKLHVVLKGTFTPPLPTTTSGLGSTPASIQFTKPQSKLASKFFLDLNTGTLKRVA